ncbi:hypothetical protein AgCh_030540 [Apium graveolens]
MAEVTDAGITSIYGNGSRARLMETDSGLKIPPRPPAHHIERKGEAKVGTTLCDSKDGDMSLITNFESDKSATEFSYNKKYGLKDGHVIMLGVDPLSNSAVMEALHAYPGDR